MAVIAYFVVWALVEELLKLVGVKIAVAVRRFIITSLVWFFFFEALLKVGGLTKNITGTRDEIIGIFFGASIIGISTSIIHLYTSIYYFYSKNPFFAVLVCTILHSAYNIYGDIYIGDETRYSSLVTSAWVATTIIAIILFLMLKIERRFVPALEA
ncbi:hypothetical protein IB276_18545 [Ensifer sp. ENS04]|uniref:hypothetical protein n=1 Tax=Ensifer sp. ENS04 TaxID=2769281 RepID=UPI00177A9B28|nr:hypothetical protein [Ensifer sp. ENS04]MBD9541456.1 hypothetical protein [Ensifer sp. ENS04]